MTEQASAGQRRQDREAAREGDMAPYLGGSAPAMAAQVAEGYTLVTAVQLKRLTSGELARLQMELERMLRDLRGTVVPPDEAAAVQAKNRKLTRINGALQQIGMALTRRGT